MQSFQDASVRPNWRDHERRVRLRRCEHLRQLVPHPSPSTSSNSKISSGSSPPRLILSPLRYTTFYTLPTVVTALSLGSFFLAWLFPLLLRSLSPLKFGSGLVFFDSWLPSSFARSFLLRRHRLGLLAQLLFPSTLHFNRLFNYITDPTL